MRKRWKEEGVGEPRTVKQLMGPRKVTPSVLDFIVATRAGQRAQRQQQEWRQKEKERNKEWCLEPDRIEGDKEEEAEEGQERERE